MYVIYALFVDEQDDLLVKLKTEKVNKIFLFKNSFTSKFSRTITFYFKQTWIRYDQNSIDDYLILLDQRGLKQRALLRHSKNKSPFVEIMKYHQNKGHF